MTFPFVPDGLLVPALVNLGSAEMQSRQAQGAPLPPAFQAQGIIDSGTTITAVCPRVLQQLNVPPDHAGQSTSTPMGKAPVQFYRISFTIYDLTAVGPDLHRHEWTVTDLPENLDGIDILFGQDLLREIVLTVNGPVLTFSLDF